jgi:hypothetical protein
MSATAVAQFYEFLSPQQRQEARALLDKIDGKEDPVPVQENDRFRYFIDNPQAMRQLVLENEAHLKAQNYKRTLIES